MGPARRPPAAGRRPAGAARLRRAPARGLRGDGPRVPRLAGRRAGADRRAGRPGRPRPGRCARGRRRDGAAGPAAQLGQRRGRRLRRGLPLARPRRAVAAARRRRGVRRADAGRECRRQGRAAGLVRLPAGHRRTGGRGTGRRHGPGRPGAVPLGRPAGHGGGGPVAGGRGRPSRSRPARLGGPVRRHGRPAPPRRGAGRCPGRGARRPRTLVDGADPQRGAAVLERFWAGL